jgi:hypothetical protein
VWNCGEKLTSPERVGTFLNFSIVAASVARSWSRPERRIAVATPSIAAEPARKPPVNACSFAASARTALFGSSPKTDA